MKRTLLISLIALLVLTGGGIAAYYFIRASNTPTPSEQPKPTSSDSDTDNNDKEKPPEVSGVNKPAEKPENAVATSTGILKHSDGTYTLDVDNAPSDPILDLSQYSGNVQSFIGKKVTVKVAETKTADDAAKTLIIIVQDITAAK